MLRSFMPFFCLVKSCLIIMLNNVKSHWVNHMSMAPLVHFAHGQMKVKQKKKQSRIQRQSFPWLSRSQHPFHRVNEASKEIESLTSHLRGHYSTILGCLATLLMVFWWKNMVILVINCDFRVIR